MPSLASAFTAELEQEAAATRRILERVPQEHLGWRPHPKSMTLGQLAQHIAQIPGRIAQMATHDGFDVTGASFAPAQPESAAELGAALEASLEEARQHIAAIEDEAMGKPWRMHAAGRELMSMPRRGLLRTIMLNHWYHHRGQLTVYLRLLDVALPAIYGTSADENPIAAAAANG